MAPVDDGGRGPVLILPLATQVIFPSMRQTIEISKQQFDEVCDYLEKTGSNGIGAVALQPGKRGGVGTELYEVGTFCRLVSNSANGGQDGKDKASPGQVQITVEGGERFKIVDFVETSPQRIAAVQFLQEAEVDANSVELRALIGSVQEKLTEIVKQAQDGRQQNAWGKRQLKWPSSATMLADVVGATLPQLSVEERQQILETLDVRQRLELVLDLLQRETAAQRMSSEISSSMQRSRELEVRRAFLQRQIQEVQRGLQKLREKADSQDGLDEGAEGEEDEKDEVTRLAERLAKAGLSEDGQRIVKRELKRLKNIPAHHPEYTTTHTYLETMASLPWKHGTKDRFDIGRARTVLDGDHRGLEKVKKRILEFLAVQKMRGNMKGPILCLHGPPGIGKTSLGKSIARAMGRQFHRVALGGVRDEAELRGHRRTYIGSMPGVIIQAFQQLGVNNPVILLDEIDKMSQNQMFNPQATMLEILDPEQNDTFKDHYLNTSFDLSKVLFIATANDTSLIDRPLLDRMEVLELSGYTLEEKVAIADSHLLPKQRRLHALEPEMPEPEAASDAGGGQPAPAEDGEAVAPPLALLEPRLTLTPEAMSSLILKWTAESGVRSLERRMAELCRWATLRLQGLDSVGSEGTVQDPEREATLQSVGPDARGRLTIDAHHLPHIIGVELFEPDIAERLSVGVAMGLSVSAVGGQMLFIEATRNAGSGRLIITGRLGSVMSESIKTAMSLLRSRFVRTGDGASGSSEVLDLLHSRRAARDTNRSDAGDAEGGADSDIFKGEDIHVHFPAGSIPKDGPSAGVAVLLALASLLLNRPMRSDTAVTGEVTLRGHVLPVGGIRDKVLAAHRAGVKHVLVPMANKRNVLEDVPAKMLNKVEVHYLKHVNEAIDWAFGRPADDKKSDMTVWQDPVQDLPPGIPAAAAAALGARAGTFCLPPSARL